MEKKQSRGLIVLVVILILIVLGLGGYLVYDKVLSKEEPKNEQIQEEPQKEEDFYSIDNLVKNKYIQKITDTEITSDGKTYLKIDNNNVYVAKNPMNYEDKETIKNTTIKNPKSVAFITYQSIPQNPYYVLTQDGDLYTGFVETEDIEESNIKFGDFISFRKINTQKIVDIYNFYEEKQTDNYPFEPYTIFAATEDGRLLKVSKGTISSTTFEEEFPYPDKICFDTPRADSCYGINIAPDKKMYIEKYEETESTWEQIKYDGKDIYFKDVVSDIGIAGNKGNVYIISNDNTLYTIPYDDNDYKIANITSQKIKDYNITKEKGDYYKVTGTITFEDNTTKTIKGNMSSTFYYRNNN